MSSFNPWLPGYVPRPRAHTRVICFHYAGGNFRIFHSLGSELERRGLDVVPVQNPRNLHSQANIGYPTIADLAAAALDVLRPGFDRPFALVGYSMGGFVALEMSRQLHVLGFRRPEHLFVLSCGAPGTQTSRGTLHRLSDEALLGRVEASYGGVPAELLSDPDLLQVFLPALRDDLRLYELYRAPASRWLRCPITVAIGRRDPLVVPHNAERWRSWTEGPFELVELDAGHFVLQDQPERVATLLSTRLPGPRVW